MPVAAVKTVEPSAPRPRKKAVLPPFATLAKGATLTNAVPFAVLLTIHFVRPAFGLLGGFLVGLAVHGMLYVFVDQGLSLFSPTPAYQNKQGHGGQVAGFAALAFGKFLVIAALLFALVVWLKMPVLYLALGFLLTQGAMITMVMRRLASTKATD